MTTEYTSLLDKKYKDGEKKGKLDQSQFIFFLNIKMFVFRERLELTLHLQKKKWTRSPRALLCDLELLGDLLLRL